MRTLIASLMVLASVQEPVPTPTPTPRETLVVRTSLELIQVDAIVTDKKGRYVTDLGPDDFAIYEDGHRQKITNCTYVPLAPPVTETVQSTSASLPVAVAVAKALPPRTLSADKVRRTMVLLVDDLNTDMWSMTSLRESLARFVEHDVQPGDLVSIAMTGRGSGRLQQFTADKHVLGEAAANVRFNVMAGALPFPTIDTGSLLAGADGKARNNPVGDAALDAESLMYGSIHALRSQLTGLKDIPGRKSLMFFSRGYPSRYRGTDNRLTPWGQAIPGLVDLANRASVVVYAIDPIGISTGVLNAADNLLGPSNVNRGNGWSVDQFRAHLETMAGSRDRKEEFEGLRGLAEPTGGALHRGSNDPTEHIDKVIADQQGYYLVGYVPISASFLMNGNRPVYHRVKVEVRRKGLRVRSRDGFYGVADDDARLVHTQGAMALRTALLSPFGSSDIAVRVSSLFFDDPARGLLLHSFMSVDPGALSFARAEDGSYKADVELLAVTFDADGRGVDQLYRSGELRLSAEAYERARKRGVQYVIDVPVKKPGSYQLRVALRDKASGRLGSAFQFVKVPDLGKKRLALSGILLAPGLATENPSEVPVAEAAYAFAAGQPVTYGLNIYNARVADAASPPLSSQMRLFSEDGREVVSGTTRPVDLAGQPPDRVLAGGTFELPRQLTPGNYVLQVKVTNTLAPRKDASADQSIAFEVAP